MADPGACGAAPGPGACAPRGLREQRRAVAVLPASTSERQLLPPGLASLSPCPGLLPVCRPAIRLGMAIGNVKP